MNIAFDMMGGDFAPEETTKALVLYLSQTSSPSELFLIGDNGGTDLTSTLLQSLDHLGLIQRHDWRGEAAFQSRFYRDAIPKLCGLADVCAVIGSAAVMSARLGHWIGSALLLGSCFLCSSSFNHSLRQSPSSRPLFFAVRKRACRG